MHVSRFRMLRVIRRSVLPLRLQLRVCVATERSFHWSPRSTQTFRPTGGQHVALVSLNRQLLSSPPTLPFNPLHFFKCYSTSEGEYKVVYTGPLKGAVRAIKIFSLSTAVAAFFGGPVLIWLGNPSVPIVARVALSSLVMLVGLSTTGILHWLMKGYIMHMEYNERTHRVAAYTLSLFAQRVRNEFHLSEATPPTSASGFSTFQALGKSYFLHTDVFHDKKLLSAILGPYMAFENKSD